MKILLGLLFIIFVGVLLVALHKRGVLKKVSLPEVGKISFLTSKRIVRTIILFVLVWFFWSLIRETGSSLYQWRSREFRAKPKSVQVNRACTYCFGGGCEVSMPAVIGPGSFTVRNREYGTTATYTWNLSGEGRWTNPYPSEHGPGGQGGLRWKSQDYRNGEFKGEEWNDKTPDHKTTLVLLCQGSVPHPNS